MSKIKGKNFYKDVQMHLACADDDMRPQMECVYFKSGFAYATDGVILVKNRLDEMSSFEQEDIDALDGKFLQAQFYKDILKYDDCLISDEGIECHKGDDKAFFYFTSFGDETKYPNADKVLEDALNKPTVPLPTIAFDIKNMERLRKALSGIDQCVAMFKGTNKPIVFQSVNGLSGSVGLIVPIYFDDKYLNYK